MAGGWDHIAQIWAVDFEFGAPPGERPEIRCMVARRLQSRGETIRMWADDLARLARPPIPGDGETLIVTYYGSAEWGCYLQLGWPLPQCSLDLYAEWRNATNGIPQPCGWGLLGAMVSCGLSSISAEEKEEMRELALRGGTYTDTEKTALLDYCESDVVALEKLLGALKPQIDLPRAILRSAYMQAAAQIEHRGVPIDVTTLAHLRADWTAIQQRLIDEINANYGVFDGRSFRADRWGAWLEREGIPWPRLASGALDLSDDTFREQARSHPRVAPMRELRHALGQLRLNELAVGADGRNRCMLSAFRSRTGRNQPSNSRYIFGPSAWLRGLIKPPPGKAVAYVDWSQQEHGIAAALSGDSAMQGAYLSGDPYMRFAIQAGAAPEGATKKTHKAVRELYKACVLAVQYGMGAESLAHRIGKALPVAQDLLRRHREVYGRYWEWQQSILDTFDLGGVAQTTYGWTLHRSLDWNPRSIGNFPMQGNGAEMLRLACIGAMEAGIEVVAPVHDAVLIEADIDAIDDVVAEMQRVMVRAAEAVLAGFALRSDAAVVRHPDRYADERGAEMWRIATAGVGGRESAGDHPRCPLATTPVSASDHPGVR